MSRAAFSASVPGHNQAAVDSFSADALLGLPVRLHGIELGRTIDVVVDPAARVLGLEVICRDDCRRFLPLAAAEIAEAELRVDSPLTLMETGDSAFYRKRSSTLNALRGNVVFRRGRSLGALRDFLVAPSGELIALLVDDGNGPQRVPFDTSVAIGVPRARIPAA